MWPWGHLAVGYLLLSAWTRGRYRRPPGPAAALAVAVGTQFPDLVDKPLAWTVAVLPSGRSLTHTLLVAVPIVLVVLYAAERRGHRGLGAAFGVGYLSHVFADGLASLPNWELEFLTYLGWPLLPVPPYEMDSSFVEHFANIDPTPYFLFQLALTAVAVGVWLRDGHPGTGLVRRLRRSRQEA